jgi:hypothetical protein
MRPHAGPDDRHLADLAIGIDVPDLHLLGHLLKRPLRVDQVLLGDREGHLGIAAVAERFVLDDRVDDAAGVG